MCSFPKGTQLLPSVTSAISELSASVVRRRKARPTGCILTLNSHTGTNPSLPLTFLLLRAQSRGPKWPTGEPGKYRKRIDIWLALHCCRLLQQGWPPRWPGTVWFSVQETPASQENLQSWANWEGWSCYLQPLACTTMSSLPVSTLSRSRLHTFWEQRLGHMELFFLSLKVKHVICTE